MTRILKPVYQEVKHSLKTADLEILKNAKEPRWRNTARWERKNMLREGLLRDDTPVGIWAISEKGRKYLKEKTRFDGEAHAP